MYLIVNKVVELKVVHISDSNGVIELFARASVVNYSLTVFSHACLSEHFSDVFLVSAVEYRGHYLPAQLLCSHAKVNFKHLTDVHTGRL